jgi:hypothetical protein
MIAGLPSNDKKATVRGSHEWAETLLIGCFSRFSILTSALKIDFSENDENYALSNKYGGGIYSWADGDLQTDKSLAAFMIVYGLVRNDWFMVDLQIVGFLFEIY